MSDLQARPQHFQTRIDLLLAAVRKAGMVRAICALVIFTIGTGEGEEFRAARSVHLVYPAPAGLFFYNEVVVEQSVNGSYFMACGWGKGYFGIQELVSGKKLALFSVWDPAAGDDPK